MTCAQGLLRLLWGGGPEVGVLRDCVQLNVFKILVNIFVAHSFSTQHLW